MKATELLKSQHKEVKDLFKRIEEARSRDEESSLFEELAQSIVAHDAIEREIFYPACEKEMGMTKLLGEALVEHGVVEFSLHVADAARGGDDFDHKVQVLSEMIKHHVKEEETELLPKVEKALGADLQETLATEMKTRFEEVQAEDFRGPLQKKLEQVLAGASTAHATSDGKKPASRKAPAKADAAKGAAHSKNARASS